MKNINLEIKKLLDIKEVVDDFNNLRKLNKKVVPISATRYAELAASEELDINLIYFVLDEKTGQYIDGYLD